MVLALYAHPFDLDAISAHGGVARLRDLGFGELVLAASYHDGRWLQPWQPRLRVRFLEDGTVHYRPRADYGELRPRPSSEVPAAGPTPLERFGAAAQAAGLRLRAWTVGAHNSRLGVGTPGVCVRNAFGDAYTYALCPAQPAVRQYLKAMVQDVVQHAGLSTIELEAFGQMGFKHSSHHDKASFVPSGLLDAALSACFCSACCLGYGAVGIDVPALQRAVANFVDAHIGAGDAMAPSKVPKGPEELALADGGAEWLPAVLSQRQRSATRLAEEMVVASGTVPRAVQVHPDPWFTGSQLAAPAAAAFPVADERVLTCYGDSVETIAKLLAGDGAAVFAASPRRLCIWPKAPQFTRDQDLLSVRDLCRSHGVEALAIYHLGLLPWRTLERVARVLRS